MTLYIIRGDTVSAYASAPAGGWKTSCGFDHRSARAPG
jgi:hypothetical protein